MNEYYVNFDNEYLKEFKKSVDHKNKLNNANTNSKNDIHGQVNKIYQQYKLDENEACVKNCV